MIKKIKPGYDLLFILSPTSLSSTRQQQQEELEKVLATLHLV